VAQIFNKPALGPHPYWRVHRSFVRTLGILGFAALSIGLGARHASAATRYVFASFKGDDAPGMKLSIYTSNGIGGTSGNAGALSEGGMTNSAGSAALGGSSGADFAGAASSVGGSAGSTNSGGAPAASGASSSGSPAAAGLTPSPTNANETGCACRFGRNSTPPVGGGGSALLWLRAVRRGARPSLAHRTARAALLSAHSFWNTRR
jgi:hypothetical protein